MTGKLEKPSGRIIKKYTGDIEEELRRLEKEKILDKFYISKLKSVVKNGKVYWEIELVRKKTASS